MQHTLTLSAATLLLGSTVAAGQSGPIVLDVACADTVEIHTVGESESDLRRLTDFASQDAWAAHPAWSPDGRAIAFNVIWHKGERHRSEIYVMSRDGSHLRPLTRTPSGRSSWNASWAPDGKQVVFVSDRDGIPDIYVMKLDGTGLERLTVTSEDGRYARNPDWSPDGRRIAFDSNRDGHEDIYILDLASRQAHAAGSTPPDKASWTPAWAPDGRQIAFASNRDGADELYVMNADGSNIRRINVLATGRPRWSPDGRTLIFQRFANPDREEVWTAAVDGSEARRLVSDNRCSIRHPDWHGRQR